MNGQNGAGRLLACAAFAVAAAAAQNARAQEADAQINIERRGLIEIPGVLRSGDETHWGAANLIVFGPTWGYSAQDYALSNIKREGAGNDMTLSGDLSVPGTRARVEQKSAMAKRADGSSALRMEWRITHPGGEALGIQKAFVQFPFAAADFGGAAVAAANGESTVFPAEPGAEIKPFYGVDGVTIKGKDASGRAMTFRLSGKNLLIEFVDARRENPPQSAYWMRVLLPGAKDAASAGVAFEVGASFPPFVHKAGADWTPFPFTNDAKPGTILDFSFLNDDAPAGKHGRVINKDGHYAFEKTGKRVRFTGANLCFEANFLEKADADALARQFRRLGYNAVRFHHTDVSITRGGWDAWNNRRVPVETNPAKLDRIDYMLHAMKEAGIYTTIDLYAMGLVNVVGKGVRGELKALMPIDDDVFNAWAANALAWLNHVNPYTGLAWKDDPALIAICPVNEDSIASVWSDHAAKSRYDALFEEWKKTHPQPGRTDEQRRARFLTETKAAANSKIERFMRANGVKALLSGSNWWNTMAQTFEREGLGVVDHHQYADHPSGNPRRHNQKSTLREGNPTYMIPVMMAPNRVFGKPFIVTEYNFCPPNMHRAEAGAMMGAYAALQDWDALYRFAWSHDPKNIRAQEPITHFDAATDPVSVLTERQIALFFGRGDISPAANRICYAVTMDEATQDGVGDMWGRGLFPHKFNALALVSQIGSQAADGGRAVRGDFKTVVAAQNPGAAVLAGNPFTAAADLPDAAAASGRAGAGAGVASDTGEIIINNRQGSIRIAAEKSACVVAPAGAAVPAAGPLSVGGATAFCSVSASAMDGRALPASRRVLLFHITNVINSGMRFTDASMTRLLGDGSLPYLAKTGSVSVSLANSNAGLRLYPLKPDGARMAPAPARYADGAYSFTLALAPGDAAPTMMYELAP